MSHKAALYLVLAANSAMLVWFLLDVGSSAVNGFSLQSLIILICLVVFWIVLVKFDKKVVLDDDLLADLEEKSEQDDEKNEQANQTGPVQTLGELKQEADDLDREISELRDKQQACRTKERDLYKKVVQEVLRGSVWTVWVINNNWDEHHCYLSSNEVAQALKNIDQEIIRAGSFKFEGVTLELFSEEARLMPSDCLDEQRMSKLCQAIAKWGIKVDLDDLTKKVVSLSNEIQSLSMIRDASVPYVVNSQMPDLEKKE